MKIIDQDPVRVGKWSSAQGGAGVPAGTAIGLEIEGELIAAVLYDQYNGGSVNIHLTIKKGAIVTPHFIWYAFHYPFNEMKVKKILGFVNSDRKAALSLYARLGSVEEYRIPDAAPEGELVVVSMTRKQCRFLGASNEQSEATASARLQRSSRSYRGIFPGEYSHSGCAQQV